jgi:hypothetical protein
MFNFSETISLFGNDHDEPHNPTGYIHADGLNGSEKLVMAGLPKHGTRWARAQNPMPRELNLEERNAPL